MRTQPHDEQVIAKCFNKLGVSEEETKLSKIISGGSGVIVAELLNC
ncbi:hypothetical protein [Paenibacillus sp. NPDC057934]